MQNCQLGIVDLRQNGHISISRHDNSFSTTFRLQTIAHGSRTIITYRLATCSRSIANQWRTMLQLSVVGRSRSWHETSITDTLRSGARQQRRQPGGSLDHPRSHSFFAVLIVCNSFRRVCLSIHSTRVISICSSTCANGAFRPYTRCECFRYKTR